MRGNEPLRFQKEGCSKQGTANAKALGWAHTWCVQGIAGGPCGWSGARGASCARPLGDSLRIWASSLRDRRTKVGFSVEE